MEITLKLFATLADYLPQEVDGRRRAHNQIALDVAEGTTVQSLIDRFQLPTKMTHLVLVNGVYITPSARAAHALAPGDALAIWPPIAGG
jgi:molybdopterin converting factor small subunit